MKDKGDAEKRAPTFVYVRVLDSIGRILRGVLVSITPALSGGRGKISLPGGRGEKREVVGFVLGWVEVSIV